MVRFLRAQIGRRSSLCAFLGASVLVSSTASAQSLVISEFRLRGTNGASDEFVEIYNASATAHTVATADGSSGYAVAASDGIVRFTIPNGTVIPARGHYLGTNSVGYSIGSYPSGGGANAIGDATYTRDIPTNAGIALFKTATPASFTLANRLDAVGSTSETKTLYREGAGYGAVLAYDFNYSFYRRIPGTGAIRPTTCAMPTNPVPADTGNNASDFLFTDTSGVSMGGGQRLGAPGPENLASPITSLPGTGADLALLAPAADLRASPNRVRVQTPDRYSTFGTIALRRRFTNDTGRPLTRLRFRVVALSTYLAPDGVADLRVLSSSDESVTLPDNTTVTVRGTTLEQLPAQLNGGGFNNTLSVGAVSASTPLAAGAFVDVQFLVGVQQKGDFQLALVPEALPAARTSAFGEVGNTETTTPPAYCAIATTTTLTSSAESVVEGDGVTLSAEIGGGAGIIGNVVFLDGATELATVAVVDGKAQYVVAIPSVGTHSYTARYAGAGDYVASTSTAVTVEVIAKPTPATDAAAPPPSTDEDAATPPANADAATPPANAADAAVAPAQSEEASDDSGCNCNTTRDGDRNAGSLWLLGLTLAAVVILRRRR